MPDLDRPTDERLKKLCGVIVPGEGTIETSRLTNEVVSMARELLASREALAKLRTMSDWTKMHKVIDASRKGSPDA